MTMHVYILFNARSFYYSTRYLWRTILLFNNVMRYNSYATAVQAQRVLHFSASFFDVMLHFYLFLDLVEYQINILSEYAPSNF